MLKVSLKLLIFICLFTGHLLADVNVLIVGTTKDKGAETGWKDSKPFNIVKVKTELEKILSGANLGTVNVSLHDFSANGRYGNSLIGEFYSDITSYPPLSRDIWSNLRGESGTDWDYVILAGEPFTIETFPGIFTLGAAEFSREIAKGNAETVLLMPWPGNGSSSSVDHYKEVVYRTGRTLGLKVAPAGLAWEAEGSVHGGAHPSDDSAYLAAASIYSRIWAKSASTSSYNYNNTLADSVHQTVLNNIGKEQYTGLLQNPAKIFDIHYNQSRNYGFGGPQSSTENGVRNMAAAIAAENGIDTSEGEGTLPKERGILTNRSYLYDERYPMITAFLHPGNSGRTNESYYNSLVYDTSSSPYYQLDNIETDHSGTRFTPCALMWAQFCKLYPDEKLIESQHGSRHWKRVIGAYMFTMFTGRCGMGPKPAEGTNAYKDWQSTKIGYETAWTISRLQGRAPGFRVMPSHRHRQAVDPLTPETMTVQFVLPAQKNVTVNISTDKAWASVSPQTLTFNGGDTETVQEVTLSVTADAVNHRGEIFNITYTTVSEDEVCDGLNESWAYRVNSLPLPQSGVSEVISSGSVSIPLSVSDVDLRQSHTFQIIKQPENGTVVVDKGLAVYVPNPGFFGPDSFEFLAHDGLAANPESTKATMDIIVYPALFHDLNLLYNNSAELSPLSESGWSGDWQSVKNPSGVNPRTGSRVFEFPANLETALSYQDIKLDSYKNHIDAGIQQFELSAFINDGAKDDIRIRLEFFDANGAVLGTPYESERTNKNQWTEIKKTLSAPAGAVIARIYIKGTRLSGAASTGWVEDINFKAIEPPNTAPVAINPPVANVAQEVPNSINLTASDIDQDALSFRIVQPPQYGTITGTDANGMPIYVSNSGYLGDDSFTYVANDGQYDSNEAVAQISVKVNSGPVINYISPKNTSAIYMTLTNGIIVEGTVVDDGAPVTGSLTYWWKHGKNQPIVFGSPDSLTTTVNWGDFNPGKYSIQLYGSDGAITNRQGLTIHVLSPPYENPYGGNVAPQIDVGGPYTGVMTGQALQLEGESLFDDGKPATPGVTSIEWLKVSGPGNAVFSDASSFTSNVTFDTPGEYILRLTADDGQVKVYEDVSITVGGGAGNSAPVANNGSITTDENTAAVVTLSASDADGDTLTYSIVSAPSNGTLSGSGANRTYTPNVGFHGSDSFTFRVNDGQVNSNTATVSITVNEVVPANSAPVANNSSLTTDENTAAVVTLSASDADGDTLTYSIVSAPSNGTLSGSGANRTYTPNVGFHGSDSFTFRVNDGQVNSNTATVSITVNEAVPPAGDSPVSLISAAGRIAWFTFDSDASDNDGNLNLTLSGAQAAAADAKYGSGSLQMNGTAQSGKIADSALLNTGGPWSARTIALWFKLDTVSGRQLIMEEGGTSRGFNIYVDNGSLYVGGWDKNKDSGDVDTWNGTWLNLGSVNAGEWYHVAFVLDAAANPGNISATAFKAYLNGAEAASGDGMQISAHGDDFGLGKEAGKTLYHDGKTADSTAFNGKIDDLAIWNRALSSAELAVFDTSSSSSTVEKVSSASRISWFTFDSDVSDADGNLTINLSGAQATAADAKYGSGSLQMSASGQFGTISNSALLNTGGPWSARTTALWFKLDSTNGRQVIFEEGGGSRGFNIYIDNGSLYVGGWDKKKDSGDVDTWNGTWLNLGTVTAGEWYHAAFVLDATANPGNLSATAFKAYLNGVEAAAGNGMQMSSHSDGCALGKVNGGTVFHGSGTVSAFIGKIDDLAIWNRALSSAELALLASSTASQAASSEQAAGSEIAETEEPGASSESGLISSELRIGGNGPLSAEEKIELSSTIDLLVLNEGIFTMIVESESGTYTFHLKPGEIFDYQAIAEDEFSVTYSSSEEIMNLLEILFADDPVLEVTFP